MNPDNTKESYANCDHTFVKKGKSYERFSIVSLSSPNNFSHVFPSASSKFSTQSISTPGLFLCSDCVTHLHQNIVQFKNKH